MVASPDTKTLTTKQARPSRFGVRSPYRTSVATSMRPERLARLLQAADEGDTDAYFTLAGEIEERDTHYDSVLRSRKLAVSGEQPNVRAASDRRIDQKVADACRTLVAAPEFEGLVFDLLDGLGKGISLVEIDWQTEAERWTPKSYTWRPQRFFTWDPETLSIPRVLTDANPSEGEELAPWKWAVHTPKLRSGPAFRGGLARAAITIWMLKSYTLRDWMAFLEVFGLPIRVGRYPASATPDQIRTMQQAVADIASDAGCAIPESMKIDFVEPGSRTGGEKLFRGTAEFWNAELSKLVLGQTMTTEDGSSLGQAVVHERKELMINRADARAVAATITRDVLTPFVRLNFGDTVEVPALFFEIRSVAEQKAFMENVTGFVAMGGEVEQSVVRDKLGLPDPPKTVEGQDPPKLLRAAARPNPGESSTSTPVKDGGESAPNEGGE